MDSQPLHTKHCPPWLPGCLIFGSGTNNHLRRCGYPLYKSNSLAEFDDQCSRITTSLNQGRITKKQRAKCYSLVNSLKVLENLDMKYNDGISFRERLKREREIVL